MSSSRRQLLAPPRLLVGVTLLFWGGVTGHPVVGLVCALLVVARSWTDLRWNFGERGFVRAWALTVILATLSLAWFWLQGNSDILLFDLLVWMPVYLLPVMLAQTYAIQPIMPLNTFSFIARRKMLVDRAAGRAVNPVWFDVGYPYLCLVLVASALSRINEFAYFVGLIILASSALVFASPLSRKRPVSMAVGLILVVILSGGGSVGLFALSNSLTGIFAPRSGVTMGNRAQTAIGQLGMIKQSKRLYWRVNDPEPAGPRLFREAVYNRYGAGQWWHKPVEGFDPKGEGDKASEMFKREDDYEPMWDRELLNGERQFAFEPDEFDRDPRARRRLRVIGKVRTTTPLPLPDSTQRISGLRVTDGGVDYNSLGTVRLENPDHNVVSFEVFFGGRALYEQAPDSELDLQVPSAEHDPSKHEKGDSAPARNLKGIEAVCEDLELEGLSAQKATVKIKSWFIGEFTYSMYLSHGHKTGHRYAISEFLDEDDRSGHCEYFATAAALLLREAGIPARYCVGFSAQERSKSGEWLLRGSHAHSWCRVWVGEESPPKLNPITGELRRIWGEGKWVDFDPTPPGWLAIEGSGVPWDRKFLDWWQRKREDFLLWRTASGNTEFVNRVMAIVALLLLGYVSFRLWQSRTRRRRSRGRGAGFGGSDAIVTPLHGLAKPAEHWLGSRLESQTFTEWILGLGECLPATESALQRAVSFHWKARFDPIGLDPGEEGEFEELCGELTARLKEVRRSEG